MYLSKVTKCSVYSGICAEELLSSSCFDLVDLHVYNLDST